MFDLTTAQSLLDSGVSKNKVADMMGVHHSKICRLVERGVLEIYVAFDEEVLTSIDSYCFENEDAIQKYMYEAYESPIFIDRSENNYRLSRYIKTNFGNIFNYLEKEDYLPLISNINVQCKNCNEYHNLEDFYIDKHNFMGVYCKKLQKRRNQKFFKENPEKIREYNFRRRSMKAMLPFEQIYERFFTECCLTGLETFSVDHFIALNTGHGGSYVENYIPLNGNLNSSKGDKNPFKCIMFRDLNRGLFNLEVVRLAQLNRLTPDEYRQFVYWCYDNKRDIDEIKRDQRHSIEIWREAVGKQFPLPRYVYEVGFLNESEVS
jgi:hypothetical protein